MRRVLLSSALLTPLLLGLLPAASASADVGQQALDTTAPVVVSTRLAPTAVTTIAGGERSTTVSMRISDESRIEGVDVLMHGPDGLAVYEAAEFVSRSGDTELWSLKVFFNRFDGPGRYRVEIDAYDHEFNWVTESEAAYLTVARASLVTADAGPEPVRKGSTVKVTGRVTRLTEFDGYVNFTGKRVNLYFRPANSDTYRYLGYTSTDSRGNYSRSYRAEVDGYWKAVSEAKGDNARSFSVDYVDVR